MITKIPENGWIKYMNPANNETLPLGHNIGKSVKIKYICIRNYLIVSPDLGTNTCRNGEWQNPVPSCQPRCSTKTIAGPSIEPKDCLFNGTIVRCDEPARPGTTVQITCKNRYESQIGEIQLLTCMENGFWSSPPQLCTPICGEEAPAGTPYVVGGFRTNITKVPWHVGIYKNNKKISFHCGGSIITEKIVLSAMHCFWDRQRDVPYEPSLFKVAAGKVNIEFAGEENLNAQYFDVDNFKYPEDYRDFDGSFAQDIVLVTLKTRIQFRTHISPICIQHGLTYDDLQVPAGARGTVAGWGLTKSGGQPSPFLKIIEMPVVDKKVCINDSDPGFRSFITPDKFCAGSKNLNVGVCQGDSGGGLAFPLTLNGRQKFYIRGIVSTGASLSDSCDSNKYTTFTNVNYFEPFIRSNLYV